MTEINKMQSELKINKSRLFKRAHYLTRTRFLSFSQALKQVWKEMKEYRKELSQKIEAAYMSLYHAYCPQLSEAMQVAAHNEMMYKVTNK